MLSQKRQPIWAAFIYFRFGFRFRSEFRFRPKFVFVLFHQILLAVLNVETRMRCRNTLT